MKRRVYINGKHVTIKARNIPQSVIRAIESLGYTVTTILTN